MLVPIDDLETVGRSVGWSPLPASDSICWKGERLSSSKRDIAKLVPSTPERVAIIERIFKECVELGRGHRSIADSLNRDGISSPRNGNWSSNTRSKWSLSTIRAILRNPAYRGDTVWNRRTFAKFNRVKGGVAEARSKMEANKPRENPEHDWIVVENTHEPLVSPPLFDRAQELMRGRSRNGAGKNFRAGSGMRSPYLLSGLLSCGRCGQNYQGRTIHSTKHRKDGSKIKTLYYACGGYVMKGNSACEKFLLRKVPLETILMETIQSRLERLLAGEGETLLRRYIEEEIAGQGSDPRREMVQIRARIREIEDKASVLLEGMSDDTKGFIDAKLRELASEKRRLTRRLQELDSSPYDPVDADAVLKAGMASLRDLPRLMESASLEERKQFVHAFIAGVTVQPEECRLDLQVRPLPILDANSSVGMVAGARYEPVQKILEPAERFVAGNLPKAA